MVDKFKDYIENIRSENADMSNVKSCNVSFIMYKFMMAVSSRISMLALQDGLKRSLRIKRELSLMGMFKMTKFC